MLGFIPDASLTLTWCFEDEALLQRLRDGDEAVVPAHWATEVSNGLLMATCRKRIIEDKARRFIDDLAALPVRIEPDSGLRSSNSVLELAPQHGLTAYDARYLDVAFRSALPLASLDDDPRKAATASGIDLPVKNGKPLRSVVLAEQ